MAWQASKCLFLFPLIFTTALWGRHSSCYHSDFTSVECRATEAQWLTQGHKLENLRFEGRSPGFKTQLCHLLALWPWVRNRAFLSPSFPICQMEVCFGYSAKLHARSVQYWIDSKCSVRDPGIQCTLPSLSAIPQQHSNQKEALPSLSCRSIHCLYQESDFMLQKLTLAEK